MRLGHRGRAGEIDKKAAIGVPSEQAAGSVTRCVVRRRPLGSSVVSIRYHPGITVKLKAPTRLMPAVVSPTGFEDSTLLRCDGRAPSIGACLFRVWRSSSCVIVTHQPCPAVPISNDSFRNKPFGHVAEGAVKVSSSTLHPAVEQLDMTQPVLDMVSTLALAPVPGWAVLLAVTIFYVWLTYATFRASADGGELAYGDVHVWPPVALVLALRCVLRSQASRHRSPTSSPVSATPRSGFGA
jgi:hypothetical protein